MSVKTTLRRQQKTQKIVLEIDVVGDEIDSEQCEKIADSFTDFVRQIWCLSDPRCEFAISSKVKVHLPKQKTHGEVQLPCASSNGQAKYISENR
ncbi:hypothetical protein [Chlorogloea sp. CCALA 695]|uniref:hypothetical protein n=1 Tax=Chlorogloea sp. CCALA 695 TaxID=2107693 RepID=UPI000D05DE6A|nr:hypothetical protein [Chlorogloea sp. CCALA 695]PSB29620.1 hypothetical protein C7B70_18215 [Chlorogloea sp. CCALA 695]